MTPQNGRTILTTKLTHIKIGFKLKFCKSVKNNSHYQHNASIALILNVKIYTGIVHFVKIKNNINILYCRKLDKLNS